MQSLINYLRTSIPHLQEETIQIVIAAFNQHELKKGTLLLKQGRVCRHLYFLEEGMSRSFTYKEEQEITTWFSFKNDFITSFTSFFPKEPSYENIQLLSDCVLFQISYDRLAEISKHSIEIERAINYFSRQYTIQLEKRLFILQTHSALEKYQIILQQEPHLIQLIPNKYLASYLGITRETLSRIRSQFN